jgi:hypothetical protein
MKCEIRGRSMKCEVVGRKQLYVDSADGDRKYTIDFEHNAPNGVCNCKDFYTRCQKEWDKGGVIKEFGDPLRTRCKHINAALLYLGNAVVGNMNQ